MTDKSHLDPWAVVIGLSFLWVLWGAAWRAAVGFAIGYAVFLVSGWVWAPWVVAAMAGTYGLVIHGIGASTMVRLRAAGVDHRDAFG